MSYFDLTKQLEEGYISPRLQEFSAYYGNRLSYEEAEKLVERVSSKQMLSDQKIGQIVSAKALVFSGGIQKSVAATLGQTNSRVVKVNPKVDIYNPEEKEILLFDDGIQVKGQTASRQPKTKEGLGNKSQDTLKSKTPAVTTDIVLLQKATGGFEYIASPINGAGEDELRLTTVVRAKVIQKYGSETDPLNLVAITDGARAIRNRLLTIFRGAVIVILDWYHLCKKLSMIAVSKAKKAIQLKFLLPQLWQGKTVNALEYLKNQVIARN
jgi:hypothetical protein